MNYSVIVITFTSAQSDPITADTVYFKLSKRFAKTIKVHEVEVEVLVVEVPGVEVLEVAG